MRAEKTPCRERTAARAACAVNHPAIAQIYEIEDADEWSKTFTLDATTPRAEFTLHRQTARRRLARFASVATGMPLMLQPLVGGLPPEHGWRCLELIASKVLA